MTTAAMIPLKLNNSRNALVSQTNAIVKAKSYRSDYVHHITIDDVRLMAMPLKERDRLLITFLFDTCFRVSEAISIRPCDIQASKDGWTVRVLGKGRKRSVVAVSASMAAQLQSYAYREGIKSDDQIFPINRTRVFQIVQKAMADAGVEKPDGVGAAHVLRHSGAIHRLSITGNPKAVQDQLRHADAQMTLRYMKTLSQNESVAINQSVDYKW